MESSTYPILRYFGPSEEGYDPECWSRGLSQNDQIPQTRGLRDEKMRCLANCGAFGGLNLKKQVLGSCWEGPGLVVSRCMNPSVVVQAADAPFASQFQVFN